MKTLIRGGQVYRPGKIPGQDFQVETCDLLLDGEKIAAVGGSLTGKFDREIDAKGQMILPGLIDVHVHFREPGLVQKEGWENGSKAAARGGVTCVFEIQNNEPLSIDANRIRERHALASKGIVDFGCYGNLLPQSVPHLREMAPLVPAFKLFMGGSTGMKGIPDRKLLRDLFSAAAEAGRPIVAHCEDESILMKLSAQAKTATAADHHRLRPPEAEISSIQTAIDLVKETGATLHVFHISTGAGADLVKAAKQKNLPVTASVSIHNLIFTHKDTAKMGNLLKVNPPIQSFVDAQRLAEAVGDRVVEIIATDHAPHFLEEKRKPYSEAPSGIPSIEFFLSILYDLPHEDSFGWFQAVLAATEAPARIFGIQGKGRIEPGFDADLIFLRPRFNPFRRRLEPISRAGWTPYKKYWRGLPLRTMVRGRVVYEGGGFFEKPHWESGPWGKPAVLCAPTQKQ